MRKATASIGILVIAIPACDWILGIQDRPYVPDGDGGAAGEAGEAGEAGSDAYDFSVYQARKDNARSGVYIEPTFTKNAAATMHRTNVMGMLSTRVVAQPLYVENGPGGAPMFLIATEENHLTALQATDGTPIWDVGPDVIGQPATGANLCGGPSGALGITGTPFIDMSSGQGVVYFDAMTTPDMNVSYKHLVYAVDLSSHMPLPGWPVDVESYVPGFDSSVQNQRGALQLVNGTLYVPYGALLGDCGTFYGWVVAIPTANPTDKNAWRTWRPTTKGGGIWGPGGLPTDGTSVFATTGNTYDASTWSGGEAVIRLSAGGTFSGDAADYYTPNNWKNLDDNDLDLGGSNSVLFDMPTTPFPHLVAQPGKDGYLYILNRDNLGGMGAELVKLALGGTSIGAPAVYTTNLGTYIAMRTGANPLYCGDTSTGNLVTVKIEGGSPPKLSFAWCSMPGGIVGSPMVTTTDGKSDAIVWVATDTLFGYDGDNGRQLVPTPPHDTGLCTPMGSCSSIQSFNAPIAAHGQIAVGVLGQLYLFTP
jgi:hypothetical protein